ncbi:MAG: hypothetical protein KatS3mg068_1224 [Candidatus Sericytochromatia bacterium]|nr:MAG: hypothetical protein KatS3mg068_1224 [Candidatus Sericytochromatia bacterium]
MSKKLDKESLINLYNERIKTFSDDELLDIVDFFSSVYSKNYIKSKDDAINILIEEGIPKALSKLSKEKQLEFKQKFLAL